MLKGDSSTRSQHVDFLNSSNGQNLFELTKIYDETEKSWASKTMDRREKSASSYNMPKSDAHGEFSFSNICHFRKFSEATKVNVETEKSWASKTMDRKEKNASSYNIPKSDAHGEFSFSNMCHFHKFSEATKVNVETKELRPSQFATSEFSYPFNEVNQKRDSGDQMNELKLLPETHKQLTIVKDDIVSTPYIPSFEESAFSYNRNERTKHFSYKTLALSNSLSKQNLLETTKFSVEKKESWGTQALSEFCNTFIEDNQKRDSVDQMNGISSETHKKENSTKDAKMSIYPVRGLEKSTSSYNTDVMEMFELLNSRGIQSFFGITKMYAETKESWASYLVPRFDSTFNQDSQKFDSGGQINELKSSPNAHKQEQLLNDGTMNPEMFEYHPKKMSIVMYETEHQNTENSKKRPSCEIEVHKSKCIAETIDEKRSSTDENISKSKYPDVSMLRKERLFDEFIYSMHRDIFPLVSCVTINTPLIQDWKRRGILIKSTEISRSSKECWKGNTHVYCGIKLKNLADVIQDFKVSKDIQYLLYDRHNAKRDKCKKFQENPIPEVMPMDFLVVGLKNSIRKSEFVEKEQQLSKDIKEFQMKTEKMDEKYEKYNKMMGDAAELSQKFKERLKQNKKMSEKVSNALSDQLY